MKIKVFSAQCSNDLEHMVNDFIEDPDIKVKGIEFNYQEIYRPLQNWYGRVQIRQGHNFMVMVIYEDK